MIAALPSQKRSRPSHGQRHNNELCITCMGFEIVLVQNDIKELVLENDF
jgi:hypothetical protein